MASIGHTTKVGFGAIIGRTAGSGPASGILYDYEGTWVHGAGGQIARVGVRPQRLFAADDDIIASAASEGDPCMFKLSVGDEEPRLYVFDEVWAEEDC